VDQKERLMISKEEVCLGLAVILICVSTICYVAIGDAFKEIKRRITQGIFTLREGHKNENDDK
jgi:hypothetical protein